MTAMGEQRYLVAQNRLLQAMNQVTEHDELLDTILREMLAATGVQVAGIALVDQSDGKAIARRLQWADDFDSVAVEVPLLSVLDSVRSETARFIEGIAEKDFSGKEALTQAGFRSMAVVPLTAQDEIVGYLFLLDTKDREYPGGERRFLETVGRQIGVAVRRIQMYQRERQERHLSETLHRTSEIVNSTLELDQVLPLILEQLVSVIPYDRACITMITDGVPQMVAASGFEESGISLLGGSIEPLEPSRRVIEAGEPLIVDDVFVMSGLKSLGATAKAVRSWLGAPLWHQGEVSGAILLESFRPHNFHPEDAQVLATFASHASIAITNARLFKLVAQGKRAWEETFDAIEDGISVHDHDCIMTRVNKALAQMLGSTPQALVDQRCYRWHQCHGMEGAFCPHDRLMETGEAQSLEFDDRGRRYHLSVYPLRDSNGKVVGSVHSIKDVTEQRRLQMQLLQAEKLSAIGELVAGVAHELNNPLTTILGYAQLLVQDEDLDVGIREDLARVTREALRSRRIVENLLTFARKHEPEKSSIDINELIEHTVEMRAYQLRVDNVEVALQLYRPLPRTMADQYQLQQLFLNLINNAHHAMKEAHGGGRLLIRTALVGESRKGSAASLPPSTEEPRIRIEVHDTGPGIPREVMSKMFDPFFTTKRTGEGTGLGLSICYGIVQEHQGRIWAESTPGKGAIFIIEIPVQRPDSAAIRSQPEPETGVAQGRHRILVVDDEEGVVSLLIRLLKRDGHYVEGARGGRDALERLAEQQFDLVISDVKMPGVGGQKLHQEIHQRYPDLAHRMIFLSGDTISLETRAFLEATGNRFLRKPFSITELKQAVHEALGETSGT